MPSQHEGLPINSTTEKESKFNFFKTYAIPALLLFVIPLFSLWFFRHVQTSFDNQARASFEQSIQRDTSLNDERRTAALEFFRKTPLSRVLASNDPQFNDLRAGVPATLRFYHATFRWMILLSVISILSGVVVFAVAGVSVLCSLRSQLAQYYSLSAGWHVLRIFATGQVLIQGCLAVALSFWVTAFWFERYFVKLILIAALLTVAAAAAVIMAIFKKLDDTFEVEGVVIDRGENSPLWADLNRICAAVGTAPPDRVVAGIDNNFFVTEHAVTVDGKRYEGRTLFVSLSLLRVLHGSEADAVMAHEMAHFSGNDTLYSKKISPLLSRYGIYLQALAASAVSLPVYHFMACFRSLFEISLRRLGRQRELRADAIAAEKTSPKDMARSLLKIAAYSDYRAKVEQELFGAEKLHATVDIPGRVQTGFQEFANAFVKEGQYQDLKTAHPFDSHPPMDQRLQAVGVQPTPDEILAVLQEQADRRWYQNISGAEELEAKQWSVFEEKFKQFHERVLAYRYLPETEEQLQIVVKYFPTLTFPGKKEGALVIDHEKISFTEWPNPLRFDEIAKCKGEQSTLGHPQIRFDCKREGAGKRALRLDIFQAGQEQVAKAFDEYYSRHLTMVQYRKEKQDEGNSPPQS